MNRAATGSTLRPRRQDDDHVSFLRSNGQIHCRSKAAMPAARQGHESKSWVSAARFRALYHRWGPGARHDDASRRRSVFAAEMCAKLQLYCRPISVSESSIHAATGADAG